MEDIVYNMLINNAYTFLALKSKNIPKPIIKIIIKLSPKIIVFSGEILEEVPEYIEHGRFLLVVCHRNMRIVEIVKNRKYEKHYNRFRFISNLFSEEFVINYLKIILLKSKLHKPFGNIWFPIISENAQNKFNILCEKNGIKNCRIAQNTY